MRGGEVSKRNFQLDDTSSKNDIQQHSHSINDSHDDSTFKYSKDYMLSLYKSVDLPIDIKHHEYVVTTQGQSPLSLLEDKVRKKLSWNIEISLSVYKEYMDNLRQKY